MRCGSMETFAPFWLLFIFLLGRVLGAEYPTAQEVRGPYSLNCSNGALPAGSYGTMRFWSREDFRDLTDLCDHKGNDGQNMGGKCYRPVRYYPPNFYSIVFDKEKAMKIYLYSEGMEKYCRMQCHCNDPHLTSTPAQRSFPHVSDAELQKELQKKIKEYRLARPVVPLDDPPTDASNYPYYSDWGDQCSATSCSSFRCPPMRHQRPVPGRPLTRCVCALKPKGGGLWAQGSCAAQAVRRFPFGGKRGLDPDPDVQACACNSTYVSGSCCGSVDGLVREGPEAWLGKVVPEEHVLFG